MSAEKDGRVSEWKHFSELRQVPNHITELGYTREYIDANGLEKNRVFRWGSHTGAMCFFEPLEVMNKGDSILWRLNENHVHRDVPEKFDTQFGTFNNHNHGEFISWLGKDGYAGLPSEVRKTNELFGRGDFFIDGNYCDMFDCGNYSYAVSNLMHMTMGEFKIIRIDSNLNTEMLYGNLDNIYKCLEYEGRFQKHEDQMLVVSGSLMSDMENGAKKDFNYLTYLIRIDDKGNCIVEKEWKIRISSANSLAVVDDYVYFGQNKMITRLDITSGKIEFFTDKSDEELAALVKGW